MEPDRRRPRMTLIIEIPPELEEGLAEQARRLGLSTADYTLRLLSQHAPAEDRRAKLVSLLQSWIDDEENAAEQRETGDFLVRSLDEDRPAARRLFPPELEGVTW